MRIYNDADISWQILFLSLISVVSEAQKAELGQNWVKNVKRIMLRIALSGFEKYYSLGLWTGAIFIRRFNNI